MSEKPRETDRWQLALEEKLRELKECQETRGHTSCLSCPEILGCEIRTRYVHAVYESMNKGTGGGFEF
jgi:hypothetical protein